MLETTLVQKAIVVNADGKMLILRRSKMDSRRPLQWDLPGGLHEEGEDLIVGVEREIAEEAGIEVQGTRVIYSKTEHRTWDLGENNVVYIFYVTHSKNINITLSFEHDIYQWVTIEETMKLFEYRLHRELISYILKHNITI